MGLRRGTNLIWHRSPPCLLAGSVRLGPQRSVKHLVGTMRGRQSSLSAIRRSRAPSAQPKTRDTIAAAAKAVEAASRHCQIQAQEACGSHALNQAAVVEECPGHKTMAGAFLLADRREHQIINTEQVRSGPPSEDDIGADQRRPPSPVQRAHDTQPRFGASCCHLPKT